MNGRPPEYADSADGTRIAFHRFGSGPPVVIVTGALSTAEASGPLATALADAGLQGITPAMLAIEVPVTVLRGDPAIPLIVAATERLAETIPAAELVVVPESRDHRADPQGTSREILARLR